MWLHVGRLVEETGVPTVLVRLVIFKEKLFFTDRLPPFEHLPEDYVREVNARFECPALVKVSLSETQRCSDRKHANIIESSCPNFLCCHC